MAAVEIIELSAIDLYPRSPHGLRGEGDSLRPQDIAAAFSGRHRHSSLRQDPGDAPTATSNSASRRRSQPISISRFPGPKLIPTEPRQAALTEQWVSLVNTRMDRDDGAPTYLFAYIFPKTGDSTPDREAIEAVTPALQEEIGLLDRAVAEGRLPRWRRLYLRRRQSAADPVPTCGIFPRRGAIRAAKSLSLL